MSSACDICAHVKEHGGYPGDFRGTHCRGCHRSWTSKAQSHCTECHRHFGSDLAGDAHRKGRIDHEYCEDPKGFPVWDTPQGPVFGGRDPAALAERLNQRPISTPSVGAETGGNDGG